MDNLADAGEGSDQLQELQNLRIKGRRENLSSSEESRASQVSEFSKDSGISGFPSGDFSINLIGHSPPSPQEAVQYFYGLLGHPRLIARTSKTPFVQVYENQFPR